MSKVIVITEDGMITTEPMGIQELTDTMLKVMLGAAKQITEQVPEETRQEFKDATYDMFNSVFSQFLSEYIPDKELRSDLDAEAILEYQNKKLKEAGPVPFPIQTPKGK